MSGKSDVKCCACNRVEAWLKKDRYMGTLRSYYTHRDPRKFVARFLERTPGVVGGKLRVRGTRITAEWLLQQYYAYRGLMSFLGTPYYARIGEYPGIDIIDACLLAFLLSPDVLRENCLDC